MATATDKFTVRDWWWRKPRPARGVREGLSRMRGNSPVRFLGEGATATPLPYPTCFTSFPQDAGRRKDAYLILIISYICNSPRSNLMERGPELVVIAKTYDL